MLPEKPNALIQFWWNAYCRYTLRKHFHAVRLYGDWEKPPPSDSTAATGPTLYLANHLSFWDGIVINHLLLRDRKHSTFRVMVDEVQVHRHPFFRRVGAFSVNRGSPRDALRAISHTADLLQAGHPVLLFPQGSIRPTAEPMNLERGFTFVLDRAPLARVVVLTLGYEFWDHQRPEALVHASEPRAGPSFGLGDAAELFEAGKAALERASLQRAPGRIALQRQFDIRSLRFPGSK